MKGQIMENSWNLNKIIKNNKEFDKLISECESLINKLISYKGKITKNSKTLYEFLKLEETHMKNCMFILI